MTRTETGPDCERITLDEQFSCLSDATRRRILAALADHNPRNEREFEAVEFKPEDEERKAFEIEVHHKHLPQLAEAGLVDWDRDSGTIMRGPNFEQVRPLIAFVDEHRDELAAD